jgi:penicillin-binding protein 1C
MEHYYKQQHPEYHSLPVATSAIGIDAQDAFHFIYPADGNVISPAKQMDGTRGGIVCKVAHSSASTELFWHLDGNYIGSTTNVHHMQIQPSIGYHRITAVDDRGNQQTLCIIVK